MPGKGVLMKKVGALGTMLLAGMTMFSSSVALAASEEVPDRRSAAARNMQKFLGTETSSLSAIQM